MPRIPATKPASISSCVCFSSGLYASITLRIDEITDVVDFRSSPCSLFVLGLASQFVVELLSAFEAFAEPIVRPIVKLLGD